MLTNNERQITYSNRSQFLPLSNTTGQYRSSFTHTLYNVIRSGIKSGHFIFSEVPFKSTTQILA